MAAFSRAPTPLRSGVRCRRHPLSPIPVPSVAGAEVASKRPSTQEGSKGKHGRPKSRPTKHPVEEIAVTEQDFRNCGGDLEKLRKAQASRREFAPEALENRSQSVIQVDSPPEPSYGEKFEQKCRSKLKLRDPWRKLDNPELTREVCTGDLIINEVWLPTRLDKIQPEVDVPELQAFVVEKAAKEKNWHKKKVRAFYERGVRQAQAFRQAEKRVELMSWLSKDTSGSKKRHSRYASCDGSALSIASPTSAETKPGSRNRSISSSHSTRSNASRFGGVGGVRHAWTIVSPASSAGSPGRHDDEFSTPSASDAQRLGLLDSVDGGAEQQSRGFSNVVSADGAVANEIVATDSLPQDEPDGEEVKAQPSASLNVSPALPPVSTRGSPAEKAYAGRGRSLDHTSTAKCQPERGHNSLAARHSMLAADLGRASGIRGCRRKTRSPRPPSVESALGHRRGAHPNVDAAHRQ